MPVVSYMVQARCMPKNDLTVVRKIGDGELFDFTASYDMITNQYQPCKWRSSEIAMDAFYGENYDFDPITAEEAQRIIERITSEAGA